VGKTTFSALLIQAIIQKRLGIVLAVDADPNHNLNQKLGCEIENTIGDLREDIVKSVDSLPESMSKHDYVEYQVHMALTESDKFDLLVMGRQEGPGCYCYINNILRSYVDTLSDNYDFIVIDNEAGMEHLSRRTTKAMDVLFVVSDATKIGIETAGRIKELAKEMELKIGKFVLVLNRVVGDLPKSLKDELDRVGFDMVFIIPNDDIIGRFNMEGKDLLTLPPESKATLEMGTILDSVLGDKTNG
jgi:CO dehydrogenase maturation factor